MDGTFLRDTPDPVIGPLKNMLGCFGAVNVLEKFLRRIFNVVLGNEWREKGHGHCALQLNERRALVFWPFVRKADDLIVALGVIVQRVSIGSELRQEAHVGRTVALGTYQGTHVCALVSVCPVFEMRQEADSGVWADQEPIVAFFSIAWPRAERRASIPNSRLSQIISR